MTNDPKNNLRPKQSEEGETIRRPKPANQHDARPGHSDITIESVLESSATWREVTTHTTGPGGSLPLSAEMLLSQPSGNLFGLSQNAGMGWDPSRLLDPEFCD